MKEITNLLANGNLTPKERALMLIQDSFNKDINGVSNLTEADKEALTKVKQIRRNDNSYRVYNSYMDLWKISDWLILDMQTLHLSATAEFLRASRLILMLQDMEVKRAKDFVLNLMKNYVPLGLKLLLKNTGIEIDTLKYNLTFMNLPKEIQEDSLLLFPDCKTEQSFFEEEIFLHKYFSHKQKLTSADKEYIAEKVVDSFSWNYLKLVKELNQDKLWLAFFDGYFTSIMHTHILWKVAEYLKLNFNDVDELRQYFIEQLKVDYSGVRTNIKLCIVDWVDSGLFTKEFQPLCLSDSYATYGDNDTVHAHKEIINSWVKEYVKSFKVVDDLITNGKLKVERKSETIHKIEKVKTIVTGESIFELEDEYIFGLEFRKYIDYFMPIGIAVSFVNESPYNQNYVEFKKMQKLLDKLGELFQMDLSSIPEKSLASLYLDIEIINCSIKVIIEKFEINYHMDNLDKNFCFDIFQDDIQIEPNENTESRKDIASSYDKRIDDAAKNMY